MDVTSALSIIYTCSFSFSSSTTDHTIVMLNNDIYSCETILSVTLSALFSLLHH